VLFDLLAALLLGEALWRPHERDPSSKGTLGTTAFLALFLTLVYCAFGIGILVGELGPGLRIASAVLVLCAVCGLITTVLMTVTSVIVDRARLEVDTRTDAGQHLTGTFLTGG
jgi:peptidoglycan/LPS O-acetylase OafA/YrhL